MSRTARLLTGLAFAAFATAAQADFIDLTPASVGSSFTVNYDGLVDGSVTNGLTGQTTFKLTGVTGSSYLFDYTVNNTSSSPITASRISGFGFNTNPELVDASATGEFDTVGSGNVPQIGKIDICFKGGGGTNNCAGGGGGGVTIGDDSSGTLALDFGTAPTNLTLSDFFVRYQSINGPGMNGDSGSGRGTVSSTGGSTSTGGTPVPEPSDFALFAAGVGGILLGRRKGRAKLAKAA